MISLSLSLSLSLSSLSLFTRTRKGVECQDTQHGRQGRHEANVRQQRTTMAKKTAKRTFGICTVISMCFLMDFVIIFRTFISALSI